MTGSSSSPRVASVAFTNYPEWVNLPSYAHGPPMVEPVDAAGIANLVVRLGLLPEAEAREFLIELGDTQAAANDYVKLLERKGVLTPLQGGKLLKGDTDGYFLGGYRVLYKISSGTFGRVYRGDDPASGRVVAIKVLRNKWMQEKQKVDQFLREGRVGLTLAHPNIVQILAVNQDPKTHQYYIVMEFVEGGNLRDILGIRHKLGTEEALRMMQECADGLTHAYSRGLTHRDIKASNILVSTDKTVKLVDFGLAEMSQHNPATMSLERVTDKDEDVAVDRTLDYAGLEKATGVSKGDVRSDIYFLGHVLYEMVTGEPLMPVTRDKAVKMQRKRYEDVEDSLSLRGPQHGIHPAVQRLIAKAVSFEPAARYQSPAQFLEAIKATRDEASGQSDHAAARRASGPLTIFVVEESPKLQDAFREKLKKMGFRVLISIDVEQALKRYQQAPYHALLIDAGTAGRAGVDAIARVSREAVGMRLDLAGILILNEDQIGWESEADKLPHVYPLVRPVGMKLLTGKLRELIPELKPQAEGTD